ncbi:MAG TPA: cation diffusion facilitator family transporter [Stellaceae bacterium]|jgi:cobalt-zinc-cadmium efflux system protein
MSHLQRAVGAAVLLNTAISAGEAIAGYQANSLSLLTDSVHNLSDELALVALWLAFIVARGPSRALLRSANIFNSVGLIVVSCVLLWQAVERFFHPVPVQGFVPIVAGLGAAAANWGVARLLLAPSKHNAAIRLAYVHNLGDVWVSLAPVVAGALLVATGYSIVDPIIAAAVAIWFVTSTGREVMVSGDELMWPERIVCCHTEPEAAD